MNALFALLGGLLLAAAPVPVKDGPTFNVMAVKNGQELVVKKNGVPTTLRLAGIEPLRSAAGTAAVDRLNQTNALRHNLPVGSKIQVVEDGTGAHVFRARDGAWVNRAIVAEGFATASTRGPTSDALPELQQAESEARQAKRGMWSPDYSEHAAKPARFDRVVRSHASRSHAQQSVSMPPGGGMPALGLGEIPMTYPMYPNQYMMPRGPLSGMYTGNGNGYGYGPSFGPGLGLFMNPATAYGLRMAAGANAPNTPPVQPQGPMVPPHQAQPNHNNQQQRVFP